MKRSFLVILCVALAAAAGWAQEGQEPAVPVRAVWNVSALSVGGSAELGVVFDVPPKHHITDLEFGLFFVEAADTFGLRFGKPVFPAGEPFNDERCYRGRNLVRVPVTVTDSAAVGEYSWPIKIGYQICQEFGQEVCFLPNERDITVVATVVAKETAVTPAHADIFAPKAETVEAKSLEDRLIAALEKGSWLAFLLVFLGGIITSFTPCVYPVIPLTIGFIGASSKGKPLRGLGLSAVFVLGIAIIYSSLGLISAATGSLFGAFSGSPIVTVIVALIFGAMGLSMLGLFDITLPSSLQTKMQSSKKGPGLLAPLVIGMISGLVMAPCVGPVIVALLAWVSKTGSLFYGWALLFVFSLGLGLLFLVIGTFAGAIQALPKAGAWMDAVKKGFGWILIAAALFLMRFVIPQPFYHLAWALLLILFATLSGALESVKDAGIGKKLWKAVLLIVFILGANLLFRVFNPASGIAPRSEAGVQWIVNEEERALSEAQSANKPLIVDVYADWCAACVELDHKTYIKPEVISRLDPFVRLKLDFTRENDWVKQMKQKYEITGMPTVILFDPSGKEVSRFTGFKPASEFLALLDKHAL